MTPVKFEFLDPDGTPLADLKFEIKMAKSGFLEAVDGIVMPDTVEATTDENGVVTVLLAPSSSLYYLKVVKEEPLDDDCCAGGIFYKFYVPDVPTEVRVQDLIMDPPPSTTAWDEAAILQIMEAKIQSKQSADAAKASELVVVAAEAVVVEKAAQVAADTVAVAANALAAAASEANSKNSENAARASELAAAASAEFAGSAVQDMQEQVDEATRQAGLAGASASSAQLAANSAHSDLLLTDANVITTNNNVITTETNKQATAADVVATTALKGDVSDLKDETKVYRDEALAAVETITGLFVDGGLVDLSGGAYPPKPATSTIWRVTVGGTVTTVPEGTITYGVGDQLVYTLTQDIWYKIDNQNAVTSVNDMTGAVTLTKVSVGLPLVDNTADMNKPVSNAQQAQFDLRTPTTSRLDTTAGRLTKVGDYGENGGPAIARIATDDANNLTVSATYAFTDGGVNVPEAAYIKHIGHPTAGYCKQLAYGILTDKQYVRTQNAGVWSTWTSSVEIVDALTSTDPNKALSAKQGKVLYDLLLANNATIVRYTYSLAAGANIITGADSSGKVLSYVPGTPMIVDKDGFSLQLTKDYTASNGTSLVLATAVEQASEIAITVFGSFTVADHYTKAEADALRIAHQVGSDYISGLVVNCENGTSLTVSSGFAFVLGENKVVDVSTTLTIALSGLPTGQWYSLYLYLNSGIPAIELVTTAPSDPYRGTARTKLADTSRRLLGTFRTNTSGGLWPFYTDSSLNLRYIVDLSSAGFRVLSNGLATTKTIVDVGNVVPVISRVCNCTLTSVNTAAATVASIMPNGSPLVVGGGLQTIGSGKFVESFITDTTQKLQYVWNAAPNGGLYIDVTGFRFER